MPYRIAGEYLDENGDPVEGARIIANVRVSGAVVGVTTTDAQGLWDIDALSSEASELYVSVFQDGHPPLIFDQVSPEEYEDPAPEFELNLTDHQASSSSQLNVHFDILGGVRLYFEGEDLEVDGEPYEVIHTIEDEWWTGPEETFLERERYQFRFSVVSGDPPDVVYVDPTDESVELNTWYFASDLTWETAEEEPFQKVIMAWFAGSGQQDAVVRIEIRDAETEGLPVVETTDITITAGASGDEPEYFFTFEAGEDFGLVGYVEGAFDTLMEISPALEDLMLITEDFIDALYTGVTMNFVSGAFDVQSLLESNFVSFTIVETGETWPIPGGPGSGFEYVYTGMTPLENGNTYTVVFNP